MARHLDSRKPGDVIAALDLGSHKVCCMIAEVGADGALAVRGVGVQAARGIRAGAVVDLDAAEFAVLNAVHQAERLAGIGIHRVVVGLAAGGPSSQLLTIDLAVGGHEVTDADVRRVLDAGARLDEAGAIDAGRELVHAIPIAYALDDARGIRDPRGMFGDRLGVTLHVVTASAGTIRNLAALLDRCHLEIALIAVVPIAAGLASLVEDEAQLGATVIDMGAGTTSLAVFYEGHAVWSDVVPIGGQHVTQDIARGLATPIAEAERLKTLHGSALAAPEDDQVLIDVPSVGESLRQEDTRMPRSALVAIIQPRVEEILEIARARLDASGFAAVTGRRCVLTGGASQLPGVRELAARVLGKQVRLGRPLGGGPGAPSGGAAVPAPRLDGLGEATSGPECATAAGLLRFGARHLAGDRGIGGIGSRDGLFGRLGLWLKEHL